MKKHLVALAVMVFGSVAVGFANTNVANAGLINCWQVTFFRDNLAYGAASACAHITGGAYPMNQQRTRIKCNLISNISSWHTRNGAWVNVQAQSTATCPSGYIMTEKSIQKR